MQDICKRLKNRTSYRINSTMIPIKQFLNKIKYSKKFNPKEITIYYQDRFIKRLIPVEFKDITIEENLFITNNKTIPLHRIKEIRKKGTIIWKR